MLLEQKKPSVTPLKCSICMRVEYPPPAFFLWQGGPLEVQSVGTKSVLPKKNPDDLSTFVPGKFPG